MVLPQLSGGDVALLIVYVLTLWAPGGVLGFALGVRGWTLAATAPLLTYGLVGLAGPASSALGLRWSPVVLGVAVVIVVVAAAGLVRLLRAPRTVAPSWSWEAHVGVGVCVAAAALLGLVIVVVGMGGLRTIPQDWDAALHANGIRWIAEYGDAGLDAMTRVNWYERPDGLFYPNAYHLVATVVYELTGRDIPSVLDAGTVVTTAVLAVGAATLVRRFGGRAVTAGTGALCVVSVTAFYDMLWRGPLLPFAMGVALVPAGVVLVIDLLDSADARSAVVRIVVGAVGLGGSLSLHPGAMITVLVVTAPAVLGRWAARPRGAGREALLLLVLGAVTALLYAAQLLGSARSAAGPSVDWPADLSPSRAVGEVLLFSHDTPFPQWWLAAALLVGLVRYRKLGGLRWIGPAAGLVGVLFVVAASYDAPWAETLTRAWWNDRYRLAGTAGILLALVAAHGVAELQRLVVRTVTPVLARARRREAERTPLVTGAAVAVTLLVVFGAASHGFYLARNEAAMRRNTGDGPAVSALEVAGYAQLATMVRPDERVLNDRADGSVWMYALDGVHPVAAHYDPTAAGPDATLLAERFDRIDSDPQVRAAAVRLRVRWVVVGEGFLRSNAVRAPGLVGLDRVAALRPAWSNGAFRIYQLVGVDAAQPVRSSRSTSEALGRQRAGRVHAGHCPSACRTYWETKAR